jgi:hypothetical protein
MNKFFRPALSLLLDLKLGECSIEKRLYPLITFLARHRSALQKYIYPECFNTTMEFMWDCIIQDLEEEAVKLKTKKKPVTTQAHLLLQALSVCLYMQLYNIAKSRVRAKDTRQLAKSRVRAKDTRPLLAHALCDVFCLPF